MSPITIVATVIAKPEAIEPVKRELLQLVELTRKEIGCIGYTLHQDNENPAIFLFYETWQDHASLQAHMNSDHFIRYVSAVEGLIADKIVHKMTRLA